MTRTGGCACGQVRWSSDAPDLWAGHCHCDSCRRACSAPMTSFFGVARDQVNWSGRIIRRQSSPTVSRGHCPDCGTQVLYQNDIWPDETHLFAATLDDPALFKPQAHFHFSERVAWLEINDDLPKHPHSADDAGDG